MGHIPEPISNKYNNIVINKIILLFLFILLFIGCTQVKPWQRGYLAKPVMQLETNPDFSNMAQHVYNSREAGAVYGKGSGGGCGCY